MQTPRKKRILYLCLSAACVMLELPVAMLATWLPVLEMIFPAALATCAVIFYYLGMPERVPKALRVTVWAALGLCLPMAAMHLWGPVRLINPWPGAIACAMVFPLFGLTLLFSLRRREDWKYSPIRMLVTVLAFFFMLFGMLPVLFDTVIEGRYAPEYFTSPAGTHRVAVVASHPPYSSDIRHLGYSAFPVRAGVFYLKREETQAGGLSPKCYEFVWTDENTFTARLLPKEDIMGIFSVSEDYLQYEEEVLFTITL